MAVCKGLEEEKKWKAAVELTKVETKVAETKVEFTPVPASPLPLVPTPQTETKLKRPRETRHRRAPRTTAQFVTGKLFGTTQRRFEGKDLVAPRLTTSRTLLHADDMADILCLHGWRSNNSVSRVHVANLSLPKYFEKIDFLEGSTPAPGPSDTATGEFFDGPYFSWVDDASAHKPDGAEASEFTQAQANELRNALLQVVNHVTSRGKEYACAFGFSQGAAIVSLLSIPAVLDALKSPPLWRSAVLVCGASFKLLACAEKALGISLRGAVSWIPSLHVIGATDPAKPQSEMWLQRFEMEEGDDFCSRHTLYTDAGHGVPSTLKMDTEFNFEIREWFSTMRAREDVPINTRSQVRLARMSLRGITPRISFNNASSSSLRRPRRTMNNASSSSLRRPRRTIAGLNADYPTLLSTIQDLSAVERVPNCSGPAPQYNLSFNNQGPSLVICNATDEAPVQLSVIDFLHTAPEGAPFIRGGKGVNPLTYAAMLAFIDANGDMRRNGVTSPTELVAYPAPSGPGGAIAMLAVSSQCTAAPFDPTSTHDECVEAMNLLKPQVLLAFREAEAPGFVSAAKQLGLEIRWQTFDPNTGLFGPEKPVSPPDTLEMLRNPAEGIGMVLRTSGTTSTPKVVPLTAGALCANGAALAASLGLGPTDIALNFMPLFHIGGLSCSILATIGGGGSVICAPKFTPALFSEYVTQSKPQATWYSSVPTIHLAALNYAMLTFGNKPPRHSLRFIRSGAAALSHADALRLSEYWRCPVIPTYSMSEQMPISGKPISIATGERANTVGQPVCSSMAIIDSNNFRPVPFGLSGEICISGPNVMAAYADNPSANAKSFFFIGNRRFFRTGDVGKFDDNAFLYLTGRIKELIKHGGEQVSPAEVEAAIRTNNNIEVAVVFGVPSLAWGEDIGAALIVSEAKQKEIDAGGEAAREEFIAELKEQILGSLSALKVPTYWHFAKHGELPMTASKKYKRIGLAEALGIHGDSESASGSEVVERSAPTVSAGLSGLRYILGVGVMFNHFGGKADPLNHGPGFGQFKSSTFYFPVTVFFIMGGFTLAMAQGGRRLRLGDGNTRLAKMIKFIGARLTPLLPLYYVACLFGLVNLLVTCWPSTYSATALWQPSSNATALVNNLITCASPPVSMPYWLMLLSTIATFGLGLQAWPMWLVSSWMMYYLWFMSIYFCAIVLFPMMYNCLVKFRGKTGAIVGWFILYSVLIYAAAGVTAGFYALPRWIKGAATLEDSTQNIYALTTTLLPPLWLPSFGLGIVGYFLFDATRPYESHKWVRYAVLGDVLSVLFIAFHVAMFASVNFPYPDFTNDINNNLGEDQNSGMMRYVWSTIFIRLMSPLIALWLILISMKGKSLTSRVLEWSPLVKVLGPTAYGCFLFHQPVGQWYFWVTRGAVWNWFSYRRSFYWFSPSAMPSAWYEFALIVGVVTVFAAIMNRLLAFAMIQCGKLLRVCSPNSGSGQLTAKEIVCISVARLTGDDREISDDATLDALGLTSIGLPMLVAYINGEDEHAGLAVSTAAATKNIGELVNLIDANLQTNRNII